MVHRKGSRKEIKESAGYEKKLSGEVNAQKPHTHLHFIIILIPAECCKGNVLNNRLKPFDLQRNNFWYLLSCCCSCSSSGMFILDYLHGDGLYFILLKCGEKTPKCLTMCPPFNSFLIYHGAQVRSEKSTSSTSAKSHQNITIEWCHRDESMIDQIGSECFFNLNVLQPLLQRIETYRRNKELLHR